MATQKQYIRQALKLGLEVNPMSAIEMIGCYRLSARIYELRKEGMPIATTLRQGRHGKLYAVYHLEEETDDE